MRLLLDTHILIWALGEPKRLPKEVRAALESPANEVLFSAASIWEIAIKAQIGRTNFKVAPEEIARAAVDSGFVELPVRTEHGAKVLSLPLHHRDPFDRILVAQAMTEPCHLITTDAILGGYSEMVVIA
ncbi:MAG: type II toxin-antitoxin system VapC family toxin [Nitrosomonadales bacterium]|nr:type II toxin-antitoxin system VapC family toxin [Nitrosomonadales bacterium]